jgi:hypothetical protein
MPNSSADAETEGLARSPSQLCGDHTKGDRGTQGQITALWGSTGEARRRHSRWRHTASGRAGHRSTSGIPVATRARHAGYLLASIYLIGFYRNVGLPSSSALLARRDRDLHSFRHCWRLSGAWRFTHLPVNASALARPANHPPRHTGLPHPVAGAVRVDNQAQFHPPPVPARAGRRPPAARRADLRAQPGDPTPHPCRQPCWLSGAAYTFISRAYMRDGWAAPGTPG